MPRRLHLLPWDQPLLGRAVAWLADGWTGSGPLDLSGVAVVVPTRHSGRRLREALAAWAAERGQAVLPPRVLLPEGLLAWGAGPGVAATRVQSLLAWTHVLLELDVQEFREVFPADPPARTFAWALRLATQFARLQAELGEAGLGFDAVGPRAGDDFAESARWSELAALEGRYRQRLAAAGLADPQERMRTAASAPPPGAGLRRVVLLATPDPIPLAVSVLEGWAQQITVEVAVFGPPDGAGLFDAWGRPRAEAWASRELALGDFDRQVQVCAEPLDQAERVAACARAYDPPEGRLAVGAADPEVVPWLQHALGRAGWATFDPEGRAIRREGLFVLLESFATLARERSFAAAAALARCPETLAFLAGQAQAAGRDFSPARLLAGLDELHRAHLPASLAAAQGHAAGLERNYRELPAALAELRQLELLLTGEPFPAGAVRALGALFARRHLDFSRDEDQRLAELAEHWSEILRELEASAAVAPRLAPADGWTLVLQLLGDARRFEEKPPGAIELLGWLELLWEDVPHLVVTGMNDGRVPEAVVGDPFLPESLRVRLGLKSNAARLARDAYLLAALAACRAASGRLDLLVGKTSSAGDPLRPSRLLLRCSDAALPGRVAALFRDAPTDRASRPWHRAWRLVPRVAPPPTEIAVTAFRDYLQCPFRFYLARLLRMRAVDTEKAEWDAFDFGNLCHGALEAMGREPALRDCTEAGVLRDFLWTELERRVRKDYGTELTLPLVVQLESARQRLARAAEVQARERAEGWVIARVEWQFPRTPACTLGGLAIRGKIDRIDRHEGTGQWRVLDYKTSDNPKPPREAHCRKPGRGAVDAAIPAAAGFTLGGQPLVWTDLQLPLYLWALRGEPELGGVPACGYFQLPRAVGGTAIALWDDYTDEWHAAALRCAATVAAAIRAGKYWPPAAAVEFDSFETLFLRGVAESVDAAALAGAEEQA